MELRAPQPNLFSEAPAARHATGLAAADFVRVAERGFGDALNSYAHAMAWFGDSLFVGTTRANLCMIKFNDAKVMRVWPTKCPADVDDLDRRARIWRYDPRARAWTEVYASPMIVGHRGRKVPRDIGYRGMAVFRAAGARAASLYICGWASARAERPPIILRTSDGAHFSALPNPKFSREQNTFRLLAPFRGRLYTSPTGATRGWRDGQFQGSSSNVAGGSMVLESDDPEGGVWRPVSPPGFGDETNTTVFEMAEFNGYLYAGTLNPTDGLQIWKTRAEGQRPYRWTKVIAKGAFREQLNECATSMCVFDNALYVGTGIQNGGYDKANKVGPAAAELIRIYPDDTWDLVVGRARQTPQGFKAPLSGLSPGFDDYCNAYFWRMAAHDGWLYVGTYKWTVLIPYLPLEKWPQAAADLVRRAGVDRIVREDGGFDLWRSANGVQWEPVTLNGFGNPYNYGARTMVSTPAGLFLGTANPFGPDIARQNGRGWRYEPNPRGGLEIWLGKPRDRARAAAPSPIYMQTPALNATSGHSSSNGRIGITNQKYDEWMYSRLAQDYYDSSDFFNFGYWDDRTRTQRQASENLMEQLLAFVPKKTGSILDVACGKGATTKYLLKYYAPSRVTGINISEKQLERCRANAPGCRFLVMDATRLRFPDNSFETVICVEAAFHFDTRERFLREACRVLKPGGRLVLSDILMREGAEAQQPLLHGANYVRDLAHYRAVYAGCGFSPVQVNDATRRCWEPYFRHITAYLRASFASGAVNWWAFAHEMQYNLWIMNAMAYYVLVCATKPLRK